MTWIKGLRRLFSQVSVICMSSYIRIYDLNKGITTIEIIQEFNCPYCFIRIYDLNKGITTDCAVKTINFASCYIRIYDLNKGITTLLQGHPNLPYNNRLEFMTWIKGLRRCWMLYLLHWSKDLLEFMTCFSWLMPI